MDSVHPFIQTWICFRAQICCMLRLNCLKAARRIADHLLKQTREIIGIAKSNVPLSAGTESAVVCSSSSAHRMRTQLRYSMRLSNSEGAQRISPVLPGTGYKNGLIPWQRYEAVFILDNKRRNLSLPRSQPAVSLPASCAYTRTSPLVQLTPAIADFYPPPGCSDHKRAGFHQPDSPPAMKKWSAA